MDERNDKKILDVCCGGRMFWFDKRHRAAIFSDMRVRPKGFTPERPAFSVEPDEINDFRNLRYSDKSFKLVVFDPPHLIRPVPEQGIITKKYGSLSKNSWREDLQKGFAECWRVLADDGVLIFKWNEREKKLKEILPLFPAEPLFGHPTGSRSQTHWLCFMKLSQLN
jgi:SAM-dependent methyltransferase